MATSVFRNLHLAGIDLNFLRADCVLGSPCAIPQSSVCDRYRAGVYIEISATSRSQNAVFGLEMAAGLRGLRRCPCRVARDVLLHDAEQVRFIKDKFARRIMNYADERVDDTGDHQLRLRRE